MLNLCIEIEFFPDVQATVDARVRRAVGSSLSGVRDHLQRGMKDISDTIDSVEAALEDPNSDVEGIKRELRKLKYVACYVRRSQVIICVFSHSCSTYLQHHNVISSTASVPSYTVAPNANGDMPPVSLHVPMHLRLIVHLTTGRPAEAA